MVIVVGHRGAAGLEPENTLRSFRKAIELGVDYVESDVYLTKDKQLVVIHDSTVDRTTNGHGRVEDFTLKGIKKLDAGKGERIPTLQEVLDVTRGKVILLIELKGEKTPEPVVRTVEVNKIEEEVIITSGDLDKLKEVRRLNPNIKTGKIFGEPPEDFFIEQVLDAGVNGFSVEYHHLKEEHVKAAHEHGLQIRAWNPNSKEEMRKMLVKGVDAICTDRPDILMELKKEMEGEEETEEEI